MSVPAAIEMQCSGCRCKALIRDPYNENCPKCNYANWVTPMESGSSGMDWETKQEIQGFRQEFRSITNAIQMSQGTVSNVTTELARIREAINEHTISTGKPHILKGDTQPILNAEEFLEVHGCTPEHVLAHFTALSEYKGILDSFTMTNPSQERLTMTETLKNTGKDIATAFGVGAAQGVIGSANRKAVGVCVEKFGDKAPWLKTPAGQKTLETAIPALVMMGIDLWPEAPIPQKALVRKGAVLGVQDAGRDGAVLAMEALWEMLGPLFASYAQAGALLEQDTTMPVDFRAEAGKAQAEKVTAQAV